MLKATALLSEELGEKLPSVFPRPFGGIRPHIAAFFDASARLVIERIATSDALYHDAENTALVTLVAQDILTMEGRRSVWQLHSNAFALEHHRQHIGPHPAKNAERLPRRAKRRRASHSR